MKVDHAKDLNEKLVEQAIAILSNTIPEQKYDAMRDYFAIKQILQKGTDWRLQPIIKQINILYIYPGRKLHNKLIEEIHTLRDAMQEKRIDSLINSHQTLEGLSTGSTLGLSALVAILLGYLLYRS